MMANFICKHRSNKPNNAQLIILIIVNKFNKNSNYMAKYLLFLALCLTSLCIFSRNSLASDYILFARPRGHFGDELSRYWGAVKKDYNISQKALRDFPPHCSLTGFFPKVEPRKKYIEALDNAMEQLNQMPRIITIKGLILGSRYQKLDYIQLSSSYLFAVTKAFMRNASIPNKYLKNPYDFPYHITLRNHVFRKNAKKKMKEIQSLEKRIDLKAPSHWSLFLYERNDFGDLTIIKEFPLNGKGLH